MKLKLVFIFSLTFFSFAILSQNSSNPFEVSQRQAQLINDSTSHNLNQNNLNEVKIDQAIVDQKINPFDVNHVPIRKNKVNRVRKNLPIPKPNVSNSFIFWVMLFAWALLAIVLSSKKKMLSNITRSIFNENVLKLTKRQENGGLNLPYILFYLVYFINASVFLYLLTKKYSNVEGIKIWLYILGALVVLYLLKHLVLSFIGGVFSLSKETSLYNYSIMIFNLVVGLVLIPFNLLLAFGSNLWATPSVYVSLCILAILLIIRASRGLLIIINKGTGSIFAFFIYLCSLEIAPLLVIVRFLSSFS